MISVVTVVRNGAATILNCLETVRQQTTPAEHIVIDGQSTDGTLDLLRESQSRSPHLTFISEADKGLYDAMSKGISRAKGDVVGQLNSDDFTPATASWNGSRRRSPIPTSTRVMGI